MQESGFWQKLHRGVTKFPILVIAVILALTIFLGYYMSKTTINNDTESFLPDDNPVKVYNNKTKDIFGDTSKISISLSFKDGLYTQKTLEKIDEITSAIEKVDSRISFKNALKYLKGFSEKEVQSVISMLNEKLSEMKSDKDLIKLFKDKDTLSEYFDDEKSIAKLAKVDALNVTALYKSLNGFTDKKHKWTKRFRKIDSLTNVDFTFSTFTDTTKLKEFFDSKQMESDKNIALSNYFIEKSLSTAANLKAFINSASFEKVVSIYEVSQSDVSKYKNFSLSDLNELLSIIQSTPKQISVSNLVNWDKIKTNPKLQLFLIYERLRSFELYEKMMYSPSDVNATGLSIEMVPHLIAKEKQELIKTIREIVNEKIKGSSVKAYFSGQPVLDVSMGENMNRDLGVLFPIVIVVIIIFLFLAFKHFQGVFLPLITVILTTIWTLGTMALLGFPISLVSTIIPVLMVAVGSAYGIHVIHHYYEERVSGLSKQEALNQTSKKVGGAVIMAGLTTVAGFGSLATSSINPIKEFGIFTAVGIFYALIISLIGIPSLLKVFKLPKRLRKNQELDEQKSTIISKLLTKISKLTLSKSKLLLTILVLVFAVSLIGTFSLKVDMNLVGQFKQSNQIRKDDEYAKKNFAGTDVINIILDTKQKNGVLDYRFLQKVNQLVDEVRTKEHVGKVVSITDHVKEMHKTMNYGNSDFYRIPKKVFDVNGKVVLNQSDNEKTKAISKVLLSYIDSYNFDDMRSLIDSNKQTICIAVILDTGSTLETAKLGPKIKKLIDKTFSKSVESHLSGGNQITVEANGLVIKGQISSLVTSIIMVLILVSIMFRSLILGLVSIIPLSIAILINFALMSAFGIHLDGPTAVIANMAIGIGVDYTIHFFAGYLSSIKEGKGKTLATKETTLRSGNAILVNAFSVACGFIVLCFSSFLPLISNGWLVALTMLTTSFAALTFVPVILNKLKRFAILKRFNNSYVGHLVEEKEDFMA